MVFDILHAVTSAATCVACVMLIIAIIKRR